MRNSPYWLAMGSLLLAAAPAAHAADGNGQFSLSAGANYTSGKYGTSVTTDIWSVPITAAFQTDRWTFKLIVPYISISGAGNVIPGAGPVKNGNPIGRGLDRLLGNPGGGTTTPTTVSGSASGLGDVVASAGYQLYTSQDRTFGLDLTGKVKFGTADENKGLGTGKNDYGVSVDMYKVAGNWTPFGGVGWTKYGSSQYIKLKSALNANVGVDYRLDSANNIGTYYYYRQRIVAGGPSQSELTGYWNHKIGNRWRLQAYALAGFTNGSPDWGGGASLKFNF
ncbi:MAG: transporter [Xanthomonadaceae bacterium]|nr:transporter [Xanthomonadaceae bacterium]MDE1964894.1 transporter [Xanthomonadaceae bacterium]